MNRRSVDVASMAHKSPIPNASRIGNVIASGFIRGADPQTHKFPPTLEEQCALMFANMRRTVEAGGGSVHDILKITVWMGKLERKPVNDEWVKMFPDPASRPARHTAQLPADSRAMVTCDFTAVLGS